MKLQKKLALIMVATALLPAIAVIAASLYHSLSTTEKLSLDVARSTLMTGAEKLSGYFSQRLAEIKAYAEVPSVRSMDMDLIDPYLKHELQRHQGEYEKFIVGNPDGTFYNTAGGNSFQGGLRTFDDNNPDATPKSIAERDYWQATVAENAKSEARSYVSNPMISFTTGAKQIVVAASIRDQSNKVVGMLGGALQWDQIAKLIDEVHREVVSGYNNQARFVLVTSNGDYLYHWNPHKIVRLAVDDQGSPLHDDRGERISVTTKITEDEIPVVAEAGTAMLRGENGHRLFFDPETNGEVFIIYAPVRSAGYSVGLLLPKHLVIAPVDHLRTVLLSFSLVLCVLIVLGAPLIARQITSPLSAMGRLAQSIAKGHLSARAPVDRNDELGLLSRAFNDMAERLERRQTELTSAQSRLESTVEERTAQLRREIAHKEAFESKLKFECEKAQNYLDVAGVMLLVLRPDQTVELINKKGCELTGYAEQDLAGRDWFDICLPPSAREKARADFVNSINETSDSEGINEYEIVGKDGKHRVIQWHQIVVRDTSGRVVSVISSGEDVTERRRIDQMKRDFVSVVSHELRTPLTSIRGALGLMGTIKNLSLPPEAANLLDIASRNVERLVLLINDILDIEKIESGRVKFDLQVANIGPLIAQSIEANRAYGQQFGIRYTLRDTSEGATATVDQLRLQQIMSNLLSNAAKFSSPNDEVEIDVAREGKRLRVSVKDHGPGIPDELRPRMFQKFCQGDPSATRSKGGTGLGLSIAKALVERMDGSIDFLSARNKGTTFYFDLPIAD